MLFTMRQLLASPFAKRTSLVVLLGLLLGFAGPFGSNPPLSAPVRYAFWIGMVFAGYGTALAAQKLVSETPISLPGVRLAAIAIASALPMTFLAAWVIPLVRPGHVYQPVQLPALFAAVAAVQLAIVFTLLRRSTLPPRPAPARSGTLRGAFPGALVSRLPKRLGDEIVALGAEDHYLRVHTTLGSHLVLMRLSDAVAAIDPDLGLQVHRSWWVAEDAISEILREEQRIRVKLKTGLTVPVGRTYSAAVRSRGGRFATRKS